MREIPKHIEGYGEIQLFVDDSLRGRRNKVLKSLHEAFDACEVRDGATLSFHHHLRNGDGVLNAVLAVAASRGLRDLRVAASSLFPVHEPLVEYIRRGTVTRIVASYVSAPVAHAISNGLLEKPLVLQTHGGRARAIEDGNLAIDVAFIAAPVADRCGNLSGAEGRAACGPLGYPMVDALHARHVVGITDDLRERVTWQVDIPQHQVDFVVAVDSIGDPNNIVSGSTKPVSDPIALEIASNAVKAADASGLVRDGLSLQTGAGGASIAAALKIQALMRERNIRGSFASGGITGTIVDMLEEGLLGAVFDVQCFDLRAVDSYRRERRHLAMSASQYAKPGRRGSVVDQLDVVFLGACEVDRSFNVNVATSQRRRDSGRIRWPC